MTVKGEGLILANFIQKISTDLWRCRWLWVKLIVEIETENMNVDSKIKDYHERHESSSSSQSIGAVSLQDDP